MLADKIKHWLISTAQELGWEVTEIKLEVPESITNGDYTTNLALVAKKDAAALKTKLEKSLLPEIAQITIAGPGFLNFFLTPETLIQNLTAILTGKNKYGWNERLEKQKIIIEYTDPNIFKEFHIGHLMSNTIGEALARLLESGGAEVKRACYQGDVGLHVAKAIWAKGDYALGSRKYEEDEQAKQEIQILNQKIYQKSDEEVNKFYETGKKRSLESFEQLYQKLGTKFDFYFFESETGEFGKRVVTENLGSVFEESEGAIIFRAEKYDPHLHTRVFINAARLPTYEAKELGLAKIKFDRYPYDRSLVITGNEINQYFKVLLRAMSLIFPDLASKTKHLPHGMLRLPTGKMSSRTGEVITAESLISEIKVKVLARMSDNDLDQEAKEKIAEQVAIGAIKYAILKQAPGRDVIFDLAKSISFEGDSGPYLQYTLVRARSVLTKANWQGQVADQPETPGDLEHLLARFSAVVWRAGEQFAPQLLVSYLLELTGAFNTYYAKNKIIDHPAATYRLALTAGVAQVLENGLWLLGVPAPERM